MSRLDSVMVSLDNWIALSFLFCEYLVKCENSDGRVDSVIWVRVARTELLDSVKVCSACSRFLFEKCENLEGRVLFVCREIWLM